MVHLYTSVRHTPELLLPMLQYYMGIGVVSRMVAADLESSDDPLLQEVERICKETQSILAHMEVQKAYTAKGYCGIRTAEIRRRCHPDDWILIPDVDEFQFWGSAENLRETVLEADRSGVVFIRGRLVDRITSDGSLPEVSGPESFPLLCDLNKVIAAGCTDKIVAVKAKAIGDVTPGQHGIRGHRETIPITVQVHHLKWTRGVLAQLRRREADRLAAGGAWVAQTRALIHYLEANGGRIDVGDPRIGARICHSEPGFWAGKPLLG